MARVWVPGWQVNLCECVPLLHTGHISEMCPEADLSMFSMFGRTGAPTKRGLPQF